MRITASQYHVRPEFVRSVRQTEVQEKHAIYRFQVKLPMSAPFSLPGNSMRQVKKSPLLEIRLLFVLHLHNELFTALCRAINVVNNSAVTHVSSSLSKKVISVILFSFTSRPFKKSISKSFVISCPNIFLKPTSVNGLINFPIFFVLRLYRPECI